MGRTLTLEVPEEVYTSLVQVATKSGQPPEILAVRWLAAVTRDFVDDPLEKFIGAFKSNFPDWAERHDHYLGLDIAAELQNGEL